MTTRQPPLSLRHPRPNAALAIGERVASIRRQRGLSGRQLAELAGVAAGTISRVESRDAKKSREPSRELVRRLARVLGVPAHFIEYGIPMGVYVLIRQDDTGGTETIAAFTDEVEADEWMRTAEAAQVDENGEPIQFPPDTYSVNYVPINDTETMALFAAERLSEHAPQPKEAIA